ncbi:MAG: thioredoxin domain-containing protein [Bacteroidales bacterium]|nr:thioredoxin domain-containing protein [Bacteroidales bacterium]
MSDSNKKTAPNKLIYESSPYLLQHAYNPVDWHAWNAETLQKAMNENKMLLISIGYSACHWCHVMERESFENTEIASVMNAHFVCVKVDREERPDVDGVYMNAVQLIHGNGGWPLNAFALPDGRPFYGGTYFRPEQWMELLNRIVELFRKSKPDLEKQAVQLTKGISQDVLIKPLKEKVSFNRTLLEEAYKKWNYSFDLTNGGYRGAPKFPLPNNFSFLLRYYVLTGNDDLLDFLNLTLSKMASGGIYDHLGGGFARYSVDASWKVPHFEKMLYDNAQLISLYSKAYLFTKNRMYLKIAEETAHFVMRELTSPEGLFFSALDADSEGVEGKFYVWTAKQFSEILGKNAELMGDFFGINGEGFWEEDKNILVKPLEELDFSQSKNIGSATFHDLLKTSKEKLLTARNQRVRPGLDDKCLTSWNGLMIKALADLYIATENQNYIHAALKAGDFIAERLIQPDGSILHTFKNGKTGVQGFLEDYSFTIEAMISLFQVSGIEKYITLADNLAKYAVIRFYDKSEGLFWFTDEKSHDLVARKKEVIDNVIPSSNSSMAIALFKLGKIMENQDYIEIVRKNAGMMSENIKNYPTSFSNWGTLWLYLSESFFEVVVCGENALSFSVQMQQSKYPAKIVVSSKNESSLPVFKNRFQEGKTFIYVCSGNVCQQPVETVAEALKQMNGD